MLSRRSVLFTMVAASAAAIAPAFAIGVLVLTGLDKSVEAALVEASPQWLTELTTRF